MDKDVELPLLGNSPSLKTKGRPITYNYLHFSEFLNPNPSPDKFQKVDSHLRYLTYTDMLPVLNKIRKSDDPVTQSQLPLPFEPFNIERKIYLTDKEWHSQSVESIESQPKRSFMKTLIKVNKVQFMYILLMTFLLINCHLFGSLTLGKIMNTVNDIGLGEEIDQDQTLRLAVYFAVLYLMNLLFSGWWSYFGYTLGASMRLSTSGFLYKKLNTVTLSSLQQINIGKVINLLANDLNEFDGGPGFLAPMLVSPYTLLLSCYILWDYFGVFSLISMSLQTAIMILVIYMSNLSKGPRAEKNAATDQRIKNTNEFIENIRLIKLYAWEKPLMKVISSLREKEVVAMKKLGLIDSITRTLSDAALYVSLLIMCICYVINDGILTTEKVYASMLILNFARFWITLCFHSGRSFIVSSRLIVERLENVLEINEIVPVNETSKQYIELIDSDNQKKDFEKPIQYRNFTAFWSNSAQTPCLKDINLTIKKGQLTALVGKIGSGKTTFLLSFLREIPITTGELSFTGSTAYVEQEPAIFSGSVKDNILFGKEFEESFYSRVLIACNLNEDFKQLDHQDQTIIGERGVTLSGGQKARISLARALYARSDIYLLDDPLSAVDSRVGKIIFEKAIKEILKDKTVILVTHHLNYAKEADKVIVMMGGRVQAEGNFNEIIKTEVDLFQIFSQDMNTNDKTTTNKENLAEKERPSRKGSFTYERKASSESGENITLNTQKQTIKEEEATSVSRDTYLIFLKESKNYRLALITLASYALKELFALAHTRYLGYWAQKHSEAYYYSLHNPEIKLEDFEHSSFIFGNILIIICMSVCHFAKVSLTIKFLLESNTKLHEKMLYKISRTFVSFFDSTPIGTMLNRFSNDLGTLDKSNWPIVYDFLSLVSALIFYMTYLCVINFSIAVSCVIVMIALYKVKSFFVDPLIKLKKYELITKSPLFSEISSTLNGLVIIRGYHQGHRFIRNFIDLLYVNSQAFIFYSRSNRLFSMSLQLFLYLFCVAGILFFIYVAYLSTIAAGAFGLALVYLITIADDGSWAIRQTVFLDVNMQSAQRIQQYCILPEEAPSEISNVDSRIKHQLKPGHWPYNGHISFKNVHLKYPQTRNYALNGLTFNIEPNLKVGIVGRTGAGKSSIIQALFRIVEIEDVRDSYIEIDEINTKTMGLEKLRGSLSILPQTPVIFSGTVRRNLDPLEELPDHKLWDALDKVELKAYIQSLEKGLDTDMSISSSIFSAGQKQLVCLARVILRKSKVVVLDEATANVDMETDKIIQEKINQIFEGCVVLTIAHRLSTIAHYDKVLVMDQGVLAEYDHPYKLLVKKEGDREITREEGLFAKMVKKTGEKTSKEVFNKAYTAFYKSK